MLKKDYEVVLGSLNEGGPAVLTRAIGIVEIVVRVKSHDAESAIKIARKVISRSWAYKVMSVIPSEKP